MRVTTLKDDASFIMRRTDKQRVYHMTREDILDYWRALAKGSSCLLGSDQGSPFNSNNNRD